MELLSPAGDKDAFIAAIENGADAVYIGGKAFSARQYANNFDLQEITDLIRYAHIRKCKVYVTVNTLVDADELPQAIEFMADLASCGVDAVIIQDLGLLRLARKLLPALELHASTQMTVHNGPTANILASLGISRIVLARELTLTSIQAIKCMTSIELEVFVHGALCICYSGQCLMSSLIGGRSGNRGRCAQPCRLEYSLVELDDYLRPKAGASPLVEGHLLSTKDLNASAQLVRLEAAGVDSLKIEGRMKRPEYVATVTRVYRTILDRPGMSPSQADEADLAQVFNRGACSAYLLGRPGSELMSYKRPSNRGKYLGRIEAYDNGLHMAVIALEDVLGIGDGVEVWVSRGGRAVTEVKRILVNGQSVTSAGAGDRVSVEISGHIRPGDRCFKTRDETLMSSAVESYRSSRTLRRDAVRALVEGKVGEPLRLTLSDGDGCVAIAETVSNLESAHKRPLTADTLEKQLSRLGNTPFRLETVELRLHGDLIVPVSQLNDIRREAVMKLEAQRLARVDRSVALDRSPAELAEVVRILTSGYTPVYAPAPISTPVSAPTPVSASALQLNVLVDSTRAVMVAFDAGADRVILDLESWVSQTLDDLKALKSERLAVLTPRIVMDSEMRALSSGLKRMMELCGADEVYVGNPGVLTLVKALAREAPIVPKVILDYPLGTFNPQAVLSLAEVCSGLGLELCRSVASPELSLKQLFQYCSMTRGFAGVGVEVLAHGALTLMVSEHCFVGALTGCTRVGAASGCGKSCEMKKFGLIDKTGAIFPTTSDRAGRGHILNSRDLCTIEHIRDFVKAGVSSLRLECTGRSLEYVREVALAYRTEIDRYVNDPERYEPDVVLRRKMEALAPQGITKGHLFRGVVAKDGV